MLGHLWSCTFERACQACQGMLLTAMGPMPRSTADMLAQMQRRRCVECSRLLVSWKLAQQAKPCSITMDQLNMLRS